MNFERQRDKHQFESSIVRSCGKRSIRRQREISAQTKERKLPVYFVYPAEQLCRKIRSWRREILVSMKQRGPTTYREYFEVPAAHSEIKRSAAGGERFWFQ